MENGSPFSLLHRLNTQLERELSVYYMNTVACNLDFFLSFFRKRRKLLIDVHVQFVSTGNRRVRHTTQTQTGIKVFFFGATKVVVGRGPGITRHRLSFKAIWCSRRAKLP